MIKLFVNLINNALGECQTQLKLCKYDMTLGLMMSKTSAVQIINVVLRDLELACIIKIGSTAVSSEALLCKKDYLKAEVCEDIVKQNMLTRLHQA